MGLELGRELFSSSNGASWRPPWRGSPGNQKLDKNSNADFHLWKPNVRHLLSANILRCTFHFVLGPDDHTGEGNSSEGMRRESSAEAASDAAAVTHSLRVESNTLRHSLLPPSVQQLTPL